MGCGASSEKKGAGKSSAEHAAGSGGGSTTIGSSGKSKHNVDIIGPPPEQIAKTLEAGKQWIDPDFPPNKSSLGEVEDLDISKVLWVRPEQLVAKPVMITNGVEPGDICQGGLGDCWFLGALSVVAARMDLLRVVVQPDTYAKNGIYTFRFYKFGQWREINIDSLIPSTRNAPIFATGKDPNEMWVILIEKAYAKLHDTYNALVGGWVTDALVDMTGGVPRTLIFADMQQDVDSGKLFTDMLRWMVDGDHLMGCARSTSGTREADTGRGILQGHAYGILQVKEYKGARLIQCRNPWGQSEWKGPWSDTDKTKWTTQALADLKHTLGDDGTFWIDYSDFIKEFNKIYLCRLIDDKVYKKFVFASAWKGPSAGGCANNKTWLNNPQYRLEVHERAEVILCAQQPDTRITGGEGEHIGLAVFNSDGTKTTSYRPVVKTPIANLRETTIVQVFEPGRYNVMPFTFDAGRESPFVITAYSKGTINFVSYQGEAPGTGSSPAPKGNLASSAVVAPAPAPAPAKQTGGTAPGPVLVGGGGGGGGHAPAIGGGGGASGQYEDPDGPISKVTYEKDDPGLVGPMVKAYLEKLGQRYPALAKIDAEKVAEVVNMGEKYVKKGLGYLFGGK